MRPLYDPAIELLGKKKKILDEFCQTTGHHRKAAIRLLNAEVRPKLARRGRPRRYGPEVLAPLQLVWETSDRLCGKLLVAVMPTMVSALERHGELKIAAEIRVGAAIHLLRQRLPFALEALHTDNGGEFLNDGLISWCRREGIRLSRGRPYKKNDQAWVEQRNWQSVRRYVGYERYSTKAAYELLLRLYPLLCLQMNFLRPLRKLVSKEREGAKVSKRYDEPRTPYRRLVASSVLSEQAQTRMAKLEQVLNPADLQRRIDQLLRQLWQQTDRSKGGRLVSVG